MLKLIIDSNAFHENRTLRTQQITAIRNLAQARLIRLYIPDIVKREFVTRVTSEFAAQADKAMDAIKKANGCPLPDANRQILATLLDTLKALKAEYPNVAVTEFDSFAKSMLATPQHSASHAGSVLDAYFTGTAPFKHAKNREDFPDAFIYECAKALAAGGKDVHLISKDKNLSDHCARLTTVHVFQTLEEFISTETFQSLLRQKEAFTEVVTTVLRSLPPNIETTLRDKLILALLVEINGKDLAAPLGHADAKVWEFLTLDRLKLYDKSSIYLGEGVFAVMYHVRFTATVEYEFNRHFDNELEYDENIDYQQMGETPEGYIRCRRDFSLHTEAFITVKFDYELLRKNETATPHLAELMQNAKIDVSTDDIEIASSESD